MNPQDTNQIPQKQLNLESSDAGPKTWVVRWTSDMMSGIGVMAAAIMALLVGLVGYLPAVSRQFPVAAAVILSIVCLPMAVYFCFIAIRRMRWEHRNGGIWRKSLSGGGIVFAVFVAFVVGLVLFFAS
jgi:uncharacterized membrane-anchored protein